MAQEQTALVGEPIEVLVNVIGSAGTHEAATINTTTTRIDGYPSTAPTVTTVATGIYKISFSGVTPAPAEGDRLTVKINGTVTSTSTAWSEYGIPVKILAEERGTDNASTFNPASDQVITDAASRTASQADVSLLATAASIAGLNDFDPSSDVVANVTVVGSVTNPVTTDSASRTASQADVSSLATAASIAALNDFDPASDVVAQVTTTANVTNAVTTDTASRDASKADVSGLSTFDASTDQVVASNMRGTDSANTVAPDNASISAIKAKTDQMVFSVSGQIDANALTGGGGATAAEVYTYFVTGSNADALKADVTSLATQASVNSVDVVVDAIKAKTDQLTFTTPNSVDATATASVDESAIADAVLAGIGGNDVTISSPVASDGTTITIVRGDDYSASDARSITWTGDSDDQWPDLTDATLKFTGKNNLDSMTITPTVTQPTGSQAFRMELSKDDTEILSGRYKYDVQATLSSGRVITLVVGEMIVKQSYSDTP